MSTFIPMVSSSPPPMEEEKTFGWEDDEEFGTFAGANDSVTKETNSETDPNLSDSIPLSPEESPSKDIDFADFKTFNDNIQGSKPNVTDLPLNSDISKNNMTPSSDTNKMSESEESLELSERNSAQTTLKRDSDSGMFSSDLSPIPVAKEMLASENCDNDYPESIKLNDSSPETPEEMTISEHDNGSKEIPSQTDLDLPISVENNVNDHFDNEISGKLGSLVDSDEEFNDYSSDVLQTLSSNAAQSSMNPPIKNDSEMTECDDSVKNKKPSLGPTSTQITGSDDEEFGDFAEFSNKQSQITSKVDSVVTSATTDSESDMSVPTVDLSSKPQKEDHIESDSVENLDSNSDNVIQNGTPDDSHSKEEVSSDVSVGKNPENDNNDLSEDEYTNFSSENVKTADVVDGSSSDSQINATETLSNSSDKLDQTDLKSDTVSEKLLHDNGEMQTELENVDINEEDDTDKHNVLNNRLNDNNDDFAEFNKANDSVIENCTESQVKSDSDDFADFSCAKSSEEDKEGFANFNSEISHIENNSVSASVNDNDDFAYFSSAKSEGENQNDDDFADFSSAKSKSENNIVSPSQNDDDDFADFSSAKSKSENNIVSPSQNDDDDFADFSSAKSNSENNIDSLSQNDEDDFADFSSAKSKSENNIVSPSQNDEDDFADFSSAKSKSENNIVSPSPNDDDFADFSSAKSENNSAIKSATQQSTEQSVTNDDDDDFADFSSANKSKNVANFESKKENDDWGNFSDDDNDDFGNFNEATVIKEAPKPAASTVSQTPGLEKINTVIETCFTPQQIQEEEKNCDIIMLDSLLQGSVYTQTIKPLTHHDIIKKVLKHIEDYDNTNAVMYSWKKSHSNNRMFKTLRIDTQNMLFGLKKQAVPLSLTGLTLLEPIRGQHDSSKKDRVLANLVEPTSTDSIPQLQDMPPVEFDWHNSGLTNPLEAKTLDLDFMVLQENENNAKTRDEWDWVFQSELLDAPRSSVKPMQPLEDILKNMKSTTISTPYSESPQMENLSKEADKVIKSLPLLSFMKSKVLMFKMNS